MDDKATVTILDAAQVEKGAADVDVADVDVPVQVGTPPGKRATAPEILPVFAPKQALANFFADYAGDWRLSICAAQPDKEPDKERGNAKSAARLWACFAVGCLSAQTLRFEPNPCFLNPVVQGVDIIFVYLSSPSRREPTQSVSRMRSLANQEM